MFDFLPTYPEKRPKKQKEDKNNTKKTKQNSLIDENKIFDESKFGILVNCETHTRQNDYQVPSHYCKVYHSETLPIFYPCGAKKTSISFILLVMVFFAQFWGVTHHQFWLRRRRRQGHLFR